MPRKKKKNIYEKPICIQDIDAWFIAFYKVMGEPLPLSDEFSRKTYEKGRIPMSMDSLKLWELCSEKVAEGTVPEDMLPFKNGKQTLLNSNALINVRFSGGLRDETVINVYKAVKNRSFNVPAPVIINYKYYIFFMDLNDRLYSICKMSQEQYDAWKESDEAPKKISEAKDELENIITQFVNDFPKSKNLKAVKDIRGTVLKEKPDKSYNEYIDSVEKLRDITRKNARDHYKEMVRAYVKGEEDPEKIDDEYYLRRLLYKDGIDQKKQDSMRHYRHYKRSASKAKEGNCLFILEDLYRPMMDWTWMGLKFNDGPQDLTSIKAYEALVLSSIERKVKIPPESILLIDSVESAPVPGNRFIMIKDNDDEDDVRLVTEEEYESIKHKKYETKNKIWDGQALLDESIFAKIEKETNETHGMVLLRNHFFKACAFKTRIAAYYADNGIKEVTDMFGRRMKAKDVKMIVTPDSLKLLKFAGKMTDADGNPMDDREQLYDHWRTHAEKDFGIVKFEHASYLGSYHEIGYQILNTLPLTKEDMKNVIAEELYYLKLLKSDPAVLLHHIRSASRSLRKVEYIYNMYHYFKCFGDTEYFRNYKDSEVIAAYRKKLRRGRIKIRGDIYYLCSMPYEMLKYSGDSKKEEIRPVLNADEVYVQGMSNGADAVMCRYPHISSGGVCVLKNKNNEETRKTLGKYFMFNNGDDCNIVVVSPWNNNVMVKLGGADFDSDMVMMLEDRTMIEAAKKLKDITPLKPGVDGLPVAEADGDLKSSEKKGTTDAEGLALLDNTISQNEIGRLSDLAQYFNSYLWEAWFSYNEEDGKTKEEKDEYLWLVYECILKLSVLNELEIDRAKHEIDVDIRELRRRISDTKFNSERIIKFYSGEGDTEDDTEDDIEDAAENYTDDGDVINEDTADDTDDDIGKMLVPYFMFTVKTKSSKPKSLKLRKDKYWNCPVDHIGAIIEDVIKEDGQKGSARTDIKDFWEMTVPKIDSKSVDYNHKIKELRKRIKETVQEMGQLRNRFKGDDELKDSYNEKQDSCVEELSRGKLNGKLLVKLYREAVEVYTDNKNHKKGEPKHPEIWGNPIYIGIVCALSAKQRYIEDENGRIIEDRGIKSDPVLYAIIKQAYDKGIEEMIGDGMSNPVLTKNIKEADQPIKKIVLWGETYYYKTEKLSIEMGLTN